LPANLPEKCHSEHLIPGSLLYLPKGIWHATNASNFSVSINITFSLPTLLEITLATIRQSLVKNDFLRQNLLSLKEKNYEKIRSSFNTVVQNLNFEELKDQCQKNQDKYQLANKAFHNTLEFLSL